MIAFRGDLKIWVAAQPVDFRKSIHTLSALVSEVLRANPYGRRLPCRFGDASSLVRAFQRLLLGSRGGEYWFATIPFDESIFCKALTRGVRAVYDAASRGFLDGSPQPGC